MAKTLATTMTTTRTVSRRAPITRQPASRTARPIVAPEPEEVEEEPQLKPRTLKLIDTIRAPFRHHVAEFGRFHAKAEDLAPPFMRAFAAYQADTGASFVAFVRHIDPTVPADRDGYKANGTYMAADYLRRLVATPQGSTVEDADRPAGMSEAFIRLLAAIVALIPGNQVEKLWGVIGAELHWSERRVQNLRTEVDAATPLIESHVERNSLVVEAAA